MPSASLSGVTLNVTGLTVGQQYAMALYCLYPGNTSYTQVDRQPSRGTVAASTTKWSFNISEHIRNAGTYHFYVHIYAPGQSPQNSDTNTVSHTVTPQTIKVTITGYCGTGVSSFRMSSSGGSYQTVTATSSGVQSMRITSGETVNFTQLTPLDGYEAPYSLYYNRSGQSGWFGPASEFKVTDTSFDRRVMITATKKVIPYFSWTADDATKIAAGQPVRNITASAWNDLISRISACGGNSSSVYTAYSGSKITANHFNSMRNGISGLTGAGSVPSSVTADTSKILASSFIGLKDAINRAISYKNST